MILFSGKVQKAERVNMSTILPEGMNKTLTINKTIDN